MKKLMRLALENHTPECDGDHAPTPMEMADNFEVIDSLAAELDESSEFFEENMRAVDRLDRLVETIDLTVGTQLSPGEIATTLFATEGIYESIGQKLPRSLAMEAAGDGSQVVTKIKEATKKLLQAIIEALKKAYEWVRDYYARMTSEAARVEKYAIEASKRVKTMTGHPRSMTYESLAMAKRLRAADNASLGKLFDATHDFVNSAAQSAFGQHLAMMNTILLDFEKNQSADTLIDGLPHVIKKAYDHVFAHGPVNNSQLARQFQVQDDVDFYHTETMLGGVVGVGLIPTNEESLRHLRFAIAHDPKAVAADTVSAEVRVASWKEAQALLKNAIAICTTVRLFQREQNKLDQFAQQLSKTLDELKNQDNDFSPKAKSFLRDLIAVGPTLATGLHQQAFRHGVQASRTVVDHVMKSIEQYAEAQPAAA